MNNTERIQANNAVLKECIEIAESLPNAEQPADVILQSKSVTPTKSVQEVTADDNYTALEKVTVEAIPTEYIVPNGTLEITTNGSYDVTEKASVSVAVPDRAIVLQDKEITENGTYSADEGYDGLGQITVNVQSGSAEEEYKTLYQRIEYIESTTGCKIVTDIFADNETGMEILAKYPVLADRVPMGSRLDGNATRYYVPYPISTNSFYYGFNAGSTRSTGAKANTLYRSAVNFLNHRCVIVMEDATNASEFAYNLTETLATQSAPIGIFCYLRNVDGEYSLQSSRDMIFYSARISQGAEIIREYIPCYRKSDGEIGLYEKYTGQFLVNEGSGTFTKGADVDW